ncbi:MAG: GH3 auxin-responsive promoter family protein [Phycisphaerae bacterium]|nr:GH3 auxin-responsive promoter family protein [Phycisphaerae bacterium]
MARRSLLDSLMARLAGLHAGRMTKHFFKAVVNATATQDRLLAEHVAGGAASDFGREHQFDRIRGYADFVANVPIQSYDDIASHIDRVRNGQVTALFNPGQRILMFALTSGTTADAKYVPITPRVLADCRRGWNVWGLQALLDHPACWLRHIVQVTSPMQDHLSTSGVPCGAITGLLAATQKRLVRRYYTSPLAVGGIKDSLAKYYTIMRLAIPKDVAWAVTANPSTLLLLARTADEHREQMIRDIHDGTLSDGMPVEDDIRVALAPLMRPDPACARRLEAIVADYGVMHPRHYWNIGFLAHWTGGTMGLYVPRLAKYFGDVPSRDIGLIASEGRMSIPVADGTPGGILAVTSQFFEFVPAEEYGTPRPSVVRSHAVRQGEEYFLLLTNASGLYRYDIGDRVRVTGWVGQAPVVEFMSRDAHTSSMAGEKLTEDQVVMAMRQVCGEEDSVVDFILAPRWGEIPRYRLYVETAVARGADLPGVAIGRRSAVGRAARADACWPREHGQDGPPGGPCAARPSAADRLHLAERLDAALSQISMEYASKRKTLRLEAVEQAELPTGALAERDRKLRRARSRTSEQFKHQYLLPRPGLDADMEKALEGSNVDSSQP